MITIALYDEEDDVFFRADFEPDQTGIELSFENHEREEPLSGCVDKKLMYKFCKAMIQHLEKEASCI